MIPVHYSDLSNNLLSGTHKLLYCPRFGFGNDDNIRRKELKMFIQPYVKKLNLMSLNTCVQFPFGIVDTNEGYLFIVILKFTYGVDLIDPIYVDTISRLGKEISFSKRAVPIPDLYIEPSSCFWINDFEFTTILLRGE